MKFSTVLRSAAAVSLVCGSFVVASAASGLGTDSFESSYGTFSDPSRPPEPDGNVFDIECLQYGTGDPATFSPTPDPTTASPPEAAESYQTLDIGVLNQIRFGRIPSALPLVGGTCSSNPGASTGFGSSGFGFQGAAESSAVGEYFELGRFFHFNRTIERGLRAAKLNITMNLTDPLTNEVVPLSATYGIDLVETSDSVDPGATVDDCEFQSGTAGQAVPNATAPNPLGGTAVLCADQIMIMQTIPFRYVTFGSTQLTIEIGGFARVEDGTCTGDVIDGETIYTAEQDENALCLLGRVHRGSIQVDKTVEGYDTDGTYQFDFTEVDQNDSSPIGDTSQTLVATTDDFAGSTDRMTAEPGLYLLEEVVGDLPEGMTAGDFTCTSQSDSPIGGDSALVVIDGVEYVDLDSAESITCAITNTFEEAEMVTPTTTPDNTAQPSTTPTTMSPTQPVMPVSGGAAGGTLPQTGVSERAWGTAAFGLMFVTAGFCLILAARRRSRLMR